MYTLLEGREAELIDEFYYIMDSKEKMDKFIKKYSIFFILKTIYKEFMENERKVEEYHDVKDENLRLSLECLGKQRLKNVQKIVVKAFEEDCL